MQFALQAHILRSVLTTALLLPGIAGLVDTGDLEQLQESYRETRRQRQGVVERMQQLETTYRKLVRRISELKGKGTDQVPDRRSLEDLMRRARSVADKLERRQKELGKIDRRLRRLRAKIVDQVDRVVERLEKRLGEVSPEKRKKLVEQLNRLRTIQQRHHVPLPEAPDASEVGKTLKMASQVERANPEQMAAAADELEDTEDQIRKRLRAVRDKLESLQQSRTLARRAELFESQQRFFDEEHRSRTVARSSGSQSSQSSSSDRSTSSGASDPEGSRPNESPASREPANAAPPGSGDRKSPRSGFDGTSPRSADDREAVAPTASEEGSRSGGSGDPFESGDSFVVESDADPSATVSEEISSRAELEARIEELEREKSRLRDQAKRLEKKADKLRQRANELRSPE